MSDLALRDLLRDASAHLHDAANTLCAIHWSVGSRAEFPFMEAELREIAHRTARDLEILRRWSEVQEAGESSTLGQKAPTE